MAGETTNPTTGTTNVDPMAGQETGTESSLSNWAGPYVTDMLGRGQAMANQPYQAYMGPLTAGPSAAESAAFQGIAGLSIPTDQMGAYVPQQFTAESAQQYMNPYLMASLQPQIDEARRQAEMQRVQDAGRLTQAGAFWGLSAGSYGIRRQPQPLAKPRGDHRYRVRQRIRPRHAAV